MASDLWARKRQYADLSKELDKLAGMPERATKQDLIKAAGALLDASNDIDRLVNAQPNGCTCKKMEDDGRTWVVYDEQCQHHRWMLLEVGRIKEAYKELEKKLEKGLHTEFFIAAIQGLCASRTEPPTPEILVERATAIANAAIAGLKK